MSTFRSLLRAGGRLYRRLFQRRLDPHIREIADVLARVPTLESLSSGALYAMASATHRRSYHRGESLYYEDDPGLGLYIVESGRIRLVSETSPEHTQNLRELEANEMFGVLSLLGDFPRLESAETLTDARVLGFFRPDLKNVMRRDPKAGTEIVLALGRRVAAQHVEAIRFLGEQEGTELALNVYAEASARVEMDPPPQS